MEQYSNRGRREREIEREGGGRGARERGIERCNSESIGKGDEEKE